MSVILAVDAGQTTKKFALFANGSLCLECRFELTETGCELVIRPSGSVQSTERLQTEDYGLALEKVSTQVESFLSSRRLSPLDGVVLSVTVPGTFFQSHARIDQSYIDALKTKQSTVPHVVPALLRVIKQLQKSYPNVPLIAASNTAFYENLPRYVKEYSFRSSEAKEFDMYRCGAHGLSTHSVLSRLPKLVGRMPQRVLVCHIGSQVSVTAVKDGVAVDHTDATAGAETDCSILLQLMKSKNLRPSEAELHLKTSAGLMGLADEVDFRRLLDRKAQGDEKAITALTYFSYHLQKAIAAGVIPLGGIDTVVLTGTAAVRSPELRWIVLQGLSPIDVQVSQERNEFLASKDGVISERKSPVQVAVIRSDEMREMAQIANSFVVSHSQSKP